MVTPLINEKELLRQCQEGHLTGFSRLYDNYLPHIYRFIFLKTFHRETAEDLTSHTFLKALENIHTFDDRKGKFSSWLYRIALNTVTDYFRGRRETVDIENAWELHDNTDIPHEVSLKESLGKVKKVIARLPQEKRDLVLLRLWSGLSYQEIADITGKKEAALKMTFSRTLRNIQAEIPPSHLLILLSSLH